MDLFKGCIQYTMIPKRLTKARRGSFVACDPLPDSPPPTVGKRRDRGLQTGPLRFHHGLLTVLSIAALAVVLPRAVASSGVGSQDQLAALQMLQRIQAEATSNSRLMETASWLADVFGPRLANSPSYDASVEWARHRLETFGVDAAVEPYGEFGVTWRNEYTSVHMLQPRYMPVIAYPNTWSSGLEGRTRAPAVHLDHAALTSIADLEPYRGQLDGAVVLVAPLQLIELQFEAPAERLSAASLAELAAPDLAAPEREEERDEPVSWDAFVDFVFDQGAVALAAPDGRESYGNVLVNEVPGRAWLSAADIHPPFLVLAAEHYNRMVRILDKGVEVELELDVRIAIDELSRQDTNVIAEIPGSDLAEQVVMLGAHLDANSAGQGAIDNAGSAATVMEVMRVLRAIGLQPRRTIRMALWGGEEYGLVGSRRYVEQVFGGAGGIPSNEAHERFAIYFNKDGGSGRVRGVYLQENAALAPLATAWLEPLASFGVVNISNHANFNSDQASFDRAGLPSMMFIQDPLERRGYHTNMDTYDHLYEPDLIQSAIVIASLVAQAAMSDEAVPRSLPMTARGHRE